MMFRGLMFASLFSLTVAHAHEFNPSPVHINISVQPTEIQVVIRNQMGVWVEELLHILPGELQTRSTQWPDEITQKANKAIQSYFELALDGVPLKGEFKELRYVQEPFNQNKAYFVFTLVYPLSKAGTQLSGRAQFFYDYWLEDKEREGPHDEENEEFYSLVSFTGRTKAKQTIPIEQGTFQVSFDDVLATTWDNALVSYKKGISAATQAIPILLLVVASLLFFPKKSLWILIGESVGGLIFFFSKWAFYGGVISLFIPVCLGMLLGLKFYKRHLQKKSEFVAERLFVYHTRTAAVLLALFSIGRLLWQSLN